MMEHVSCADSFENKGMSLKWESLKWESPKWESLNWESLKWEPIFQDAAPHFWQKNETSKIEGTLKHKRN